MSFNETLDKILDKYNSLSDLMCTNLSGEEFVKTSKEFSTLEDVVAKIKKYNFSVKEIADLKEIINDPSVDKETKDFAFEELLKIEKLMPQIERDIKLSLIPKDSADEKNSVIEVRAGTGGEEAALFAYNLFSMYQRYAEKRKWKFEILSMSDTGIGGIKEAVGLISGYGSFARFKYESGVHRVQRVPQTETSGRIHTSAATVAVLPEAEDVDVKIDEKELTIDTYRASGAGGQHVNTTDSAVRITHLPTGIAVAIQDERSQHKNKAKAMKILKAKLFEIERAKQHQEISSSRKAQVGSGDRSERIRTYNFPQNRVTDHRVGITLYKIDAVLEGDLDEFIEALISEDEARKLLESGDI